MKRSDGIALAVIAFLLLFRKSSTTTLVTGLVFTDENGVLWGVYPDPGSSRGYWLAEVQDPTAPYSPSLSRPSRQAAIDAAQQYAAAHKTK